MDDALHYGDYDVAHYEDLTAGRIGQADFDAACLAASAHTLVRAYSFAIDDMADAHLVVEPICCALRQRFGFTDDDLQLVAEMKNPAGPAARAALGLSAPAPAPSASPREPLSFPTMESTATVSAISLRQPAELPDHPLLAHIPVWAPHEPEFQSLKADIAARGVDNPILLDGQGRVVDGRNRRNACAAAGLAVPAKTIPDDQVVAAILSALGNRRHVTKGAMAYLLAPLLKPAVEEARARQAAALKRGESPSSTQWTTGNVTVEGLADGYGFGRTLLFQALELHKLFAEKPELRTQFEEGVLTGMGLGGALQAIAGKLSTEGKARVVAPPEKLLFRAVTDLRNRFEAWKTMPEDKRAEVTSQFVAAAPEWPADLAVAQVKAWRAAGLIS